MQVVIFLSFPIKIQVQTIIDHHHQVEKTATKVRFAEPSDDRKEELFNHEADEGDDDTDVQNDASDEKNEVNCNILSSF